MALSALAQLSVQSSLAPRRRREGCKRDNVPFVGIRTFVTEPDYLGQKDFYPAVLNDLEAMTASGLMGYIIEQGLGGGKSYLSSVLLPYLTYRMAYQEVVLGVDPRPRMGLDPSTVLMVANVAPTTDAAKDIVFGTMLTFIQESPWFREYMPIRDNLKSRVRFRKHRYQIYPGNSSLKSVVGRNIFAALIDEANLFDDTSHTAHGEDYANAMFVELYNRISSRFGAKGFLGVISSRKTVRDFTTRKRIEIERDPETARRFYMPPPRTSWHNWPMFRCRLDNKRWRRFDADSLAWIGEPVSFDEQQAIGEDHRALPWVPEDFWGQFSTQPEEALRDLGSIPAETLEPYIRKVQAIRPDFVSCVHPLKPTTKPTDWLTQGVDFCDLVDKEFYGDEEIRYHFHVDLAKNGDACGIAVAHCSGRDDSILVEGQKRPEKATLVDLDIVIQIRAPRGGEIEFAQVRRILLWLRDVRGFRFDKSSFDGWQSVDSIQILKRQGFRVEEFSVDRTLTGYSTLKEMLYEGRLFFAPAHGQTEKTTRGELDLMARSGDPMAVLQMELRQLELVNGKKVDHPKDGSKDLADAVAGAVTQVQRRFGAPSEKLK